MVTRPEYTAARKDLHQLGRAYEDKLASQLSRIPGIAEATSVASKSLASYHDEFEDLLSTALAKTAVASASHYNKALNADLTDAELAEIAQQQIMRQTAEKYYGATLNQRLKASRLMGASRLKKSSNVGASLDTRKTNLTRIFTKSYPFGSQVSFDERLLLGQVVKLEHDVGLAIAKKSGVDVVKWTLSHKHTKKDICDEYATRIDKKVVAYLKKNKIRVSAKGMYLIDDTPEPPHPNCQCHLQMLDGKTVKGGTVRRTLRRMKELLSKLGQRP